MCTLCSVTQSCPTLSEPMDCGPPGSSVHVILQARILEFVAIRFFRGSSRRSDRTQISYIASRLCTIEPPGKPQSLSVSFANSSSSRFPDFRDSQSSVLCPLFPHSAPSCLRHIAHHLCLMTCRPLFHIRSLFWAPVGNCLFHGATLIPQMQQT